MNDLLIIIFVGILLLLPVVIFIYFVIKRMRNKPKPEPSLKTYSLTSRYFLFETLFAIAILALISGRFIIKINPVFGLFLFVSIKARAKYVKKISAKIVDEREQTLLWRTGNSAGILSVFEIGFISLLFYEYNIVYNDIFNMYYILFLYWINYAFAAFILFRKDENNGRFFTSKKTPNC